MFRFNLGKHHSIRAVYGIPSIQTRQHRFQYQLPQPTVELPNLQSKDARTGQMQVTITAVSAPAIEAVYTVKGVLVVEGSQSDVREFKLKIRQ